MFTEKLKAYAWKIQVINMQKYVRASLNKAITLRINLSLIN